MVSPIWCQMWWQTDTFNHTIINIFKFKLSLTWLMNFFKDFHWFSMTFPGNMPFFQVNIKFNDFSSQGLKSMTFPGLCEPWVMTCWRQYTVETLYSTIYYSKYFIELNFDKSTQYVALWTHKRHPIPRPFGRAMECLLWVFQQKLIVL